MSSIPQNLQSVFLEALENWLALTPDSEKTPPIDVGEFTMTGNAALMRELCHQITPHEDLMSYKTFQKLLLSHNEKPTKPDKDDPSFDPPDIKYNSEAERRVARGYRYKQAIKDYEKRHTRHQEAFAQPRASVQGYRANPDGYLDYCKNALSSHSQDDTASVSDEIFFISKPLKISESSRRRHSFLTGGTGSGKSEALKHLIRHYETKNTDTCVMVLDPHGKLAREVSRFAEHKDNDRLVYIDPNLSENHHVVLNPFETDDISVSGLETQSAQLMAAFEQILSGFTLNMESLLLPCLSVLLHRPESDLSDFVRFMDKKRNADLIHYGAEHLPFDEHRSFFEHQFQSSHYDSTREALRNRFQSLLNIPTIKQFTCGTSTINLPELIDSKKVIVFNLSVSGTSKSATRVIGQFITALVQGYAMRRDSKPKNPKIPIHFFADECQYFVSNTTEEILGESRKYGLYLTLATQRTDQVGAKILDAIMGNVGLFLVGKNRGKTVTKMSGEINIDGDEIRGLPTGNFFIGQMGRISVRTKLPYVGTKFGMPAPDWKAIKSGQIKRYYKPASQSSQRSSGNAKSKTPVSTQYKPAFEFPQFGKPQIASNKKPK